MNFITWSSGATLPLLVRGFRISLIMLMLSFMGVFVPIGMYSIVLSTGAGRCAADCVAVAAVRSLVWVFTWLMRSPLVWLFPVRRFRLLWLRRFVHRPRR